MKKLVLLIIAIFMLSACSHNIPIANIEFTKIERNEKFPNYYFLYFSSDIDFIDNLNNKHTGAQFRCFLKNSNIIDEDFINYKGYVLRLVNNIKQISNKTKSYNYSIEVRFDKEEDDFIEKIDIPKIYKLLNKEPNCLSCVVTAVTYLQTTKRYISNTMCLPKSEMIKVMKN